MTNPRPPGMPARIKKPRSSGSSRTRPAPTQAQMLAIVEQRVPHFPHARKSAIATAALAVLQEPMHKGKPLLHAVKMAIARSYRKS